MSRNVNVSDSRFNAAELETALTVAAGGSFVEWESLINQKNENQGLKVDGQNELVVFVNVSGTMPAGSEVVITPIVHNFPDLDDVTIVLDTITDGKIEGRSDTSTAIRDADFLKITYRFKQGGADYDVTALSLQVKKKSSVGGGTSDTVTIEEIGTVETAPRLDGRQMTMVLAPLRRKKARSDSGSKKADRAEDTTETVEEPEEE